ncbi:MAG TPA: hypothetical protein VIL71_03745 [Spirillospora sp.]
MDRVRAVADVVLYEGHSLWPPRRTVQERRQRWTVGGVYPRPYAEQAGERWRVRAEFLMEHPPAVGDPAGTDGLSGANVEIALRFLHAVDRRVGASPSDEIDAAEIDADEVGAGPEPVTTSREAREREITSGRVSVARLLRSPLRVPVAVAAGTEDGEIAAGARCTRLWRRVDGTIVVSAARAGRGVVRLRVDVLNTGAERDRDPALHAAMMCAHVVAHAGGGGAFVSPWHPPARLAEAAAACRSDGLCPVLAGVPGGRDTVLAAPIVLYDWPQVAPESPAGTPGGEADRLLLLGLLSLSEEERRDLAAADPRAAQILGRGAARPSGEPLASQGAARRDAR